MIAMFATHLWESTLFGLAAGAATLLFRNNGAHVRYGLWFAASLKFLIPFAALAAIGRAIGPRITAMPVAEPMIVMLRTIAPAAIPAASAPLGQPAFDPTLLLVTLWAIGFAVVVAVWTMRWLHIQGALRGATPVALDAPIPVRMTATRIEPGLVGILRPVLLMPQGIATHLTPPELRAVLAHELCHLRRRDNLTAAIHMVAQAVFWFHPLLWWIGTRLIAERENACDEAVVAAGSAPAVYAEGILKICKLHVRSPLMCAAGVAGANLKQRIERIIGGNRSQALGAPKSALLAAATLAVLTTPMLLGWASARAHTVAPVLASPQTHATAPVAASGTAVAAMIARDDAAPAAPAPAAAPSTTPVAPVAQQADPTPAPAPAPPPAATAPVGAPTPRGNQPATNWGLSDLRLANLASIPGPEPVPTSLTGHVMQPAILGGGLYPMDHLSPKILDRPEFGVVDLTVTVEPDGKVSKIAVANSSGFPRLDELFRDAVVATQFRPGSVNRVPQAMTVAVRMAATPDLIGYTQGGTWIAITRKSVTRPYPNTESISIEHGDQMVVATP